MSGPTSWRRRAEKGGRSQRKPCISLCTFIAQRSSMLTTNHWGVKLEPRHGQTRLIHGHTSRAGASPYNATHSETIPGLPMRWVLCPIRWRCSRWPFSASATLAADGVLHWPSLPAGHAPATGRVFRSEYVRPMARTRRRVRRRAPVVRIARTHAHARTRRGVHSTSSTPFPRRRGRGASAEHAQHRPARPGPRALASPSSGAAARASTCSHAGRAFLPPGRPATASSTRSCSLQIEQCLSL